MDEFLNIQKSLFQVSKGQDNEARVRVSGTLHG